MKKLILCVASAAVIFSIGIVPNNILTSTAHYPVVSPELYLYQPQVTASGVVQAEKGIKLLVGGNVIVKELYADNGSWVEAGQVVAVTESPNPQEAFLSQSIDSAGLTAMNSSQLESLASQYGIDSASAENLLGKAQKDEKIESIKASENHAVAPISGILTWSGVSKGLFLTAGTPLCTILGLDSYKAVVQVPADKASLISVGAPAVISGKEMGHEQYNATVTYVGDTISREITSGGYSSVIRVELTVDAPADAIRHGAGISCRIASDQPQTIFTLPYEAIRQDEKNQEYVYCVSGSKLTKCPVTTGLELDESIQILDGVTAGDNIAIIEEQEPGKRFVLE